MEGILHCLMSKIFIHNLYTELIFATFFQGVQYTQLMHAAGKGAGYYHQLSLQEDQGIDMTQVS